MMERETLIVARHDAHQLTDALSAQITMHSHGVTADFLPASFAISDAERALRSIARLMGFDLVPASLDSVREGSDYQMEVAAE